MISVYFYLYWMVFILFIVFTLLLIITRKPLYMLGMLFIIPTIFFYTKYNRLLPAPIYIKLEEVCSIYSFESIDVMSTSRGERAKLYYFLFDKYGEFGFRSNIKEYGFDFGDLNVNDRVCFKIQRNKDFENNLRMAKIIEVKKVY